MASRRSTIQRKSRLNNLIPAGVVPQITTTSPVYAPANGGLGGVPYNGPVEPWTIPNTNDGNYAQLAIDDSIGATHGHGAPAPGGSAIHQAFAAYLAGLKANTPPPPTEQDRLTAIFNQLYPDQTASIKAAYGAQAGAINQQYDAELARLAQENGSAVAGVRQEGTNLQSTLSSLGQDARQQMALGGQAVSHDFGDAIRSQRAEAAALRADLQRQGADTSALKQLAAQRMATAQGGAANSKALSDRYQQLLGQEINNRQATGQTVTTGSVDDLARILATAKSQAGVGRAGALAKLDASMAGDVANAQQNAAQAKFSFMQKMVTSAGRGGGRALTPSAKAAADKLFGPDNYASSFKSVFGWKDPNGDPATETKVHQTATDVLDQLSSGVSPVKIATDFEKLYAQNPDAPGADAMRTAVHAMLREAASKKQKQKTGSTMSDAERKYLRNLGINV